MARTKNSATNDINDNNNDQLTNRVRMLEQLTQTMVQLVETQVHNQGNHGGLEVTLANKLAQLKPPTFEEEEDLIILENWIRVFDKTFTSTAMPIDQIVDQAAYYLLGAADDQWGSESENLLAQPNFGWEEFKTTLRDRFYPNSLKRHKYDEFVHLEQGTMTVKEYKKKFDELAKFTPELVSTSENKAHRFKEGLDHDLLMAIWGGGHQTYIAAYEVACNITTV